MDKWLKLYRGMGNCRAQGQYVVIHRVLRLLGTLRKQNNKKKVIKQQLKYCATISYTVHK